MVRVLESLDNLLEHGLGELGVMASTAQQHKLLDYVDLLRKWNQAYNLTAVRDPRDMVIRHLLDSLSVLPYLPPDGLVLDLGTGPGLPGVPLAILRSDQSFALVDSNGKKVRFLRQVVISLQLSNLLPQQARVETLAARPERYRWIVVRAFASLGDILKLASPLLDRGGAILAMKGHLEPQEIAEVRHCQVTSFRLQVPFLDAERHLVRLQPEP